MSIEYKVLSFWKNSIARILKPGPARIEFETILPVSIGTLHERLMELPAGRANYLPGVEARAQDAGVFRSAIQFEASLPSFPGNSTVLEMAGPSLRKAFRKKANSMLLPGVTPSRERIAHTQECLILVPLKGQATYGAPFVPQKESEYIFECRLTDPPIPFHEGAAIFCLYEKRTALTRQSRTTGYIPIVGPRQTILRKGAGGQIQPTGKSVTLSLFDETTRALAECEILFLRPFGLGDTLPAFARTDRIRFSFTDELDLAVSEETFERPANLIQLMTTGDLPSLLRFLNQVYGIDTAGGQPILFFQRARVQPTIHKTLPSPQLIF